MDNRKQSYQFGFYSYIEEKVRNRAMALYREEWRVEAYVRLFNFIAYRTKRKMAEGNCFLHTGDKSNGWQCQLDRRSFLMTDLRVPIPASAFEREMGKHDGKHIPYGDMLADMEEQDFLFVNHSYELGVRPKTYSVHARLILDAERNEMASMPKWCFVRVPRSVEKDFMDKCNAARALDFVEYRGIRFRLDVDALLADIEVETERNFADKSVLTFSRAESTLDCFLDKSGTHGDVWRDSRTYHFIARTPSVARQYYRDNLGRSMKELYDIPCANLLTTALLAAEKKEIDFNEFVMLTRLILDESHPENRGIYGAFCREVGNGMMSRDFAKRAFQTVINATDAQLQKHEKTASALTGTDGERIAWLYGQTGVEWLRQSTCVDMVTKWLSSKVPGFVRWLRDYETRPNRQTGKPVKATFFGFTAVEKELMERCQEAAFNDLSVPTIRVHDALWGFVDEEEEEEVKRLCSSIIKKEVEEREGELLSLYVPPVRVEAS